MPAASWAALAQGWKDSVRACAPSNVASLSGTQTIDGVALAIHDRVLLPYQTTLTQNGLWTVQSGSWLRPQDFQYAQNSPPQHIVRVAEGNALGGTEWACVSTGNALQPNQSYSPSNLLYSRITPSYDDIWGNPWDPSMLGDNIERESSTSALQQASGTLYLHGGMVLRANKTYSALNMFFTSASSALTHSWAGLVRQDAASGTQRALIGVSADNTAAITAGSWRAFAFSAAVTPNYDTPVYFALCLVATTTVPSVAASPAATNSGLFSQGVVLSGTSNTAQTTPPAVNTVVNAPAVISQTAYGYLS